MSSTYTHSHPYTCVQAIADLGTSSEKPSKPDAERTAKTESERLQAQLNEERAAKAESERRLMQEQAAKAESERRLMQEQAAKAESERRFMQEQAANAESERAVKIKADAEERDTKTKVYCSFTFLSTTLHYT